MMDRDRRITGLLRGQSDSPTAPPGYELNNPWRVRGNDSIWPIRTRCSPLCRLRSGCARGLAWFRRRNRHKRRRTVADGQRRQAPIRRSRASNAQNEKGVSLFSSFANATGMPAQYDELHSRPVYELSPLLPSSIASFRIFFACLLLIAPSPA